MESFWGWVIVGVIGWLLYYCVQLLRRRFCDLCGRSTICRPVKGFRLCRKCSSIAESSTTPIADLITNGIPPQKAAASPETGRRGGAVKAAVLAGIGFGVLWFGGFLHRRLPVVPVWRSSMVNDTRVLILQNQTDHQLTVGLSLTRDGVAGSKTVAVPIPPNGSTEVGWAEGYDFRQGDLVRLSHPEYRSISDVVD